MKIALWILQGLLAVSFLFAGGSKIATPREKLLENPQMAWVNDFSEPQVKAIGAAEVTGAIGLIAPAALNIVPVLTPVAGGALALLMGGAAATHIGRAENPAPPIVLAVLSLLAAGGQLALLRRKKENASSLRSVAA